MKIIISNYDEIKNPYYGGGGAMSNHKIGKYLAEKNEVMIICGAFKGCRNGVVEGVFYKHIGIKRFGPILGQIFFSLLLPVFALIENYDLWVENFVPPHSTNFIPIFTNKPVVGVSSLLHAKEFSQKYGIPFYLIENLGLKFYKNILVLSNEYAKKVQKINKKAKIVEIPRGVDDAYFEIKGNENNYILYLARIDIFQKGLDLLLKAWKKVVYRYPHIKLVIAGNTTFAEERKFKQIVDQLSLDKNVKYIGLVKGEKKRTLLSNSLCVISPSRFESFGNSSLETLAAGKCLIVFDIPGYCWIPENVSVKIKSVNFNLLAVAIERVISNKELRIKYGKLARNFAENYRWKKIFKLYEAYFLNVN
ncbi:MAG: glycosyl transferase family protein [Candidatus Gottesmanbacteria bacterium GW2011_GWA2_43_14]|uniref:Glycosyl transferase family protein n=1 Tax=Candidatus Gottesmanbacteria bacterium GW2011_GWA2_43_14 TaxID=1618443 RepID=A0A0G1DKF5_9BACT|nr:MAG: glycosyl transferase family protein [Candidatus Gottesmanbacteria bacterium GW2011_GWA2_43_14]